MAEASVFQVAGIAPDGILEKSGAKAAAFAHVPVATMDSLAEPHAVIPLRLASYKRGRTMPPCD